MKRGSARKTRSRAAGPSAARDRQLRTISGLARPPSLALSVRREELEPGSCSPSATARPWPCVVLLDQAGWHTSAKLDVPANISLLPLPPKAPELNPVEIIWRFLRDNWLSNRIFASEHEIVDHCSYAWNKLIDQPWTIMSVGLRDWAHA